MARHVIQQIKQRRTLIIWAAIGVLAFVIRMAFVSQFAPDREWSDAAIYDSTAVNLLSGNGYSTDGITPSRERPPTYPLFLASIYLFTGRNLMAVVVIQALLGILTVLMTGWLASRIFDRRAGYIAAALVATYPALIYYDTRILREGLTAFLLIAVVCAAGRAKSGRTADYLILGAVICVNSLCKPEMLVLFAPALLITVLPELSLQRILRPLTFMLIPIVVGWVPWSVRNYQVSGSWSPIRTGIVSTIWFGSRWAESGGDGQTIEDRTSLKQEFQSKVDGTTDYQKVEERLQQDIQADFMSRPFWFIQMIGKKAVMFWQDANGVRRTLPAIHPALPLLLNTYYYTLLGLALLAAAAGWRREPVRALLVTIAIYASTYALLHVRNRYRVPLLPVVFILSSGGILIVWNRVTDTVRNLRSPDSV